MQFIGFNKQARNERVPMLISTTLRLSASLASLSGAKPRSPSHLAKKIDFSEIARKSRMGLNGDADSYRSFGRLLAPCMGVSLPFLRPHLVSSRLDCFGLVCSLWCFTCRRLLAARQGMANANKQSQDEPTKSDEGTTRIILIITVIITHKHTDIKFQQQTNRVAPQNTLE